MEDNYFNPYKEFRQNNSVQVKTETKEKRGFEELNLDVLIPFKNQPFRLCFWGHLSNVFGDTFRKHPKKFYIKKLFH